MEVPINGENGRLLVEAVIGGDLAAVKTALKRTGGKSSELVNFSDEKKRSPLHHAAKGGSQKILSKCLFLPFLQCAIVTARRMSFVDFMRRCEPHKAHRFLQADAEAQIPPCVHALLAK